MTSGSLFTAVCRPIVVITDAERHFIFSMVLVCVYWTNITLERDMTVYMYELKRRLMHYFQFVKFLVMISYPVQLNVS